MNITDFYFTVSVSKLITANRRNSFLYANTIFFFLERIDIKFMFSKLLVLYLYILLFFNLIYYLRAERCSRVLFASKTKTPADGRFKIEIDKNYEKYTPGTKYLSKTN